MPRSKLLDAMPMLLDSAKSNGVVAIDPGIRGGIALFTQPRSQEWRLESLDAMPTIPVDFYTLSPRRVTGCTWVDTQAIEVLLPKLSQGDWRPLVVVETQRISPKQGGAITIGANYGHALGWAARRGMPIIQVHPASWKPSLGLTSDKDDSVAFFRQLFPKVTIKATDDGRAEAALIGYWALGALDLIETTKWVAE